MNDIDKKKVLEGLNLLLIALTTKCQPIESGLCIQTMYFKNGEFSYPVRQYIIDNKPKMFHKHYSLYSLFHTHYWKPFKTEPRIKWLRYHIDKLEKELL